MDMYMYMYMYTYIYVWSVSPMIYDLGKKRTGSRPKGLWHTHKHALQLWVLPGPGPVGSMRIPPGQAGRERRGAREKERGTHHTHKIAVQPEGSIQYMIYCTRYMIYNVCGVMLWLIWYMTYDIWHMSWDICGVILDMRCVCCRLWHVIHDVCCVYTYIYKWS